ncbi:hypothetical protein [Streptomyces sp. TLI_105]|uniref:hypothetical protein n=1 Tax=Streptomyces sp. TLI_105 TaxID=1881019 RepID=UPI00115FD113|nr:hypothetical protein [Streptomyces sp. TLI_105]
MHIAAWAHLTAGRTELAAGLSSAEAARAAPAGEHLTETAARTLHDAALAAMGRTREAEEGFATVAALASLLPCPVGRWRIQQAAGAVDV